MYSKGTDRGGKTIGLMTVTNCNIQHGIKDGRAGGGGHTKHTHSADDNK